MLRPSTDLDSQWTLFSAARGNTSARQSWEIGGRNNSEVEILSEMVAKKWSAKQGSTAMYCDFEPRWMLTHIGLGCWN